MRKTLLFFISSILSTLVYSQNYPEQFILYFDEGDTLNQRLLLEKWEKDNPNDAELYTKYFNYYFIKSQKEVLSLTNEEPKGESLVLTDTLNNTAGYMVSDIHYNKDILQKGFDKIDEGIKRYPNRLDMRFGKIYTYGQVEDWRSFTNEIIVTINYSVINNNQWTWTNNEKMETSADDFLLSIQDYQFQLYETGNDDLLVNMREIALAILKHYPNHVESLSNLSITYLLKGEYEKAIEYLLRAEELRPEDYIVLGNIAEAYKREGDKDKAIEYFKKTLIYGDDQAKKYAEIQIKALNES